MLVRFDLSLCQDDKLLVVWLFSLFSHSFPSTPSSVLTTLRLDFTVGQWADALNEIAAEAEVMVAAADFAAGNGADGGRGMDVDGRLLEDRQQACSSPSQPRRLSPLDNRIRRGSTPLAPLRLARGLLYFDLMFVDSSDGSEGILDNRMVADLAELKRLEEVSLAIEADNPPELPRCKLWVQISTVVPE